MPILGFCNISMILAIFKHQHKSGFENTYSELLIETLQKFLDFYNKTPVHCTAVHF